MNNKYSLWIVLFLWIFTCLGWTDTQTTDTMTSDMTNEPSTTVDSQTTNEPFVSTSSQDSTTGATSTTTPGPDVTYSSSNVTSEDTTAPPGVILPCSGSMETWDGITYVYDANRTRYWGPCGYPNPYVAPDQCGQSGQSTNKTHVCDPDEILLGRREELHNLTEAVTGYMPDVECKPIQGNSFSENIQVAVALVRYMRVIDMDESDTLCHDDCGQVLPFHSINANTTEEEVVLSSQIFPQVLATTWEIGSCGNDVIIFFVEEYGKFSGSVGQKAKDHISQDRLDELCIIAQYMYDEDEQNDNRTFNALKHILETLDDDYGASAVNRGSGPAYMLLIILALIITVFLVYFGCTYFSGRVSHYWDEEWWEIILKYTLNILFGVFIIEGIVWAAVVLQQKVQYWWLVVPLVGTALCIMAAIILAENGYKW